jgi:hypothetical protein
MLWYVLVEGVVKLMLDNRMRTIASRYQDAQFHQIDMSSGVLMLRNERQPPINFDLVLIMPEIPSYVALTRHNRGSRMPQRTGI